jgi:hypothetical protein
MPALRCLARVNLVDLGRTGKGLTSRVLGFIFWWYIPPNHFGGWVAGPPEWAALALLRFGRMTLNVYVDAFFPIEWTCLGRVDGRRGCLMASSPPSPSEADVRTDTRCTPPPNQRLGGII